MFTRRSSFHRFSTKPRWHALEQRRCTCGGKSSLCDDSEITAGRSFGTLVPAPKIMAVFLCVMLLAAAPALGQQESIVRVHAGKASGYGVAYGGPGSIVTALHVVAGRSPITVVWKGQEIRATVEKVYKPADLALLRLQAPALNIPPLKIYPGDAPMGTPLNFWETPEKMFRMDKKETKLSRAVPLEQLDNRLEKNSAALGQALCSDGQSNYPALKTSVLKFEEKNIKKAHSGSPLTFQGHIVGMVDGGPPVNGKGFIWAIPAAGNFAKLMSEGSTAVPGSACTSERLYSGLSADNPHLQNDPELADLPDESPFSFVDDSGETMTFSLEYRARCQDVYETMFEEDQKYLRDLVHENEAQIGAAEQVTLRDLYDQRLDVYQEENTGAVIAVPAESDLRIEKSAGHTLIEASSPYEGLTMIIFAQSSDAIAESQETLAWFKDYIVGDREDWAAEPDEEDQVVNFLDDEDEPYYSELMERVVLDKNGDLLAELYASLTIDGTDFLGVVVKVNDWAAVADDRDERIFFYMMETCAILTDFAYY